MADQAAKTSRSVKIPEAHQETLGKLATWPNEKIDAILQALSDDSNTKSSKEVLKRVALEAKITPSEASDLLGTISSLYASRDHLDLSSMAELASAVTNGVVREKIGGIERGSPQAVALQERLERLLSADRGLAIFAKRQDLKTSYASIYEFGRILTDIRPIFTSGSDAKPIGSMVAHSLEIVVNNAGSDDSETQFVALTLTDLKRLRRSIDRAIAKDTALRELLLKTPLSTLGED